MKITNWIDIGGGSVMDTAKGIAIAGFDVVLSIEKDYIACIK